MEHKLSEAPAMTRLCWWLVDSLSETLEPDERHAVRGDLAECGATGSRALRDVFGLVVRRQVELWRAWRPWLIVIAGIFPFAMLLSLASRLRAYQSAVYLWMYLNNWHWGLLGNRGFWHVLPDSAATVFVAQLTLACCSWSAGFVLGAISRRMMRVSAVLFCFALLLSQLLGAPLYLAYYSDYIHRVLPFPRVSHDWSHPDPVSALMFYRVILPLLVQVVVVALPALWGMHRGSESERLPPLPRALLWFAAILTVAVMLLQAPGLGLLLWGLFAQPSGWKGWPVRLPGIVVYWPIVYLVASAIAGRWYGRTRRLSCT